jgi:hypothetical protein
LEKELLYRGERVRLEAEGGKSQMDGSSTRSNQFSSPSWGFMWAVAPDQQGISNGMGSKTTSLGGCVSAAIIMIRSGMGVGTRSAASRGSVVVPYCIAWGDVANLKAKSAL